MVYKVQPSTYITSSLSFPARPTSPLRVFIVSWTISIHFLPRFFATLAIGSRTYTVWVSACIRAIIMHCFSLIPRTFCLAALLSTAMALWVPTLLQTLLTFLARSGSLLYLSLESWPGSGRALCELGGWLPFAAVRTAVRADSVHACFAPESSVPAARTGRERCDHSIVLAFLAKSFLHRLLAFITAHRLAARHTL